jgi:hypothetical protein
MDLLDMDDMVKWGAVYDSYRVCSTVRSSYMKCMSYGYLITYFTVPKGQRVTGVFYY